jgi:uncharacterized RDD family membrane protein YckC
LTLANAFSVAMAIIDTALLATGAAALSLVLQATPALQAIGALVTGTFVTKQPGVACALTPPM